MALSKWNECSIFMDWVALPPWNTQYTYNGCLLQEIVRSSDVFIKHNFDK